MNKEQGWERKGPIPYLSPLHILHVRGNLIKPAQGGQGRWEVP